MKTNYKYASLSLMVLMITLLPGIISAQNVGIGTAAPVEKMDVIGNIRSSNLAGTGFRVVYSDANGVLTNSFGTVSPEWLTLGNSGTSPVTNFIGTIDNVNFIMRTNNTLRMWISNGGQVTVNNGTTFIGDVFSAYAGGSDFAVNGYASGTGGAGWFEANGIGLAAGALGLNDNAGGTGVIGVGNGLLTVNTVAGGTGAAFNGTNAGSYSLATLATGTGVLGVSGAAAINNVAGSGGAFSGTAMGVAAFKDGALANGTGAGWFLANTTPAANASGVAIAYRNAGTNYKVINIGPFGGLVSTDVWAADGSRKLMFCPESPEVFLQDFGKGQLVNGKATVNMDPIFAKNIVVNENHSLQVYIQLEGDCKGVYVTNKNSGGFEVIELQGGISNASFTWFVSANRADYVNPATGEVISKNEGLRFSVAPDAPIIKHERSTNKVKSGKDLQRIKFDSNQK